jgi:predicted peptidase
MKNCFFICFLFFVGRLLYAQGYFEAKTFTASNNVALPYRELLPENYDVNQKYPLVLFLHGIGERGLNNEAQLTHGSKMFTNPVNLEKYPCIVIFPQCSPTGFWTYVKRTDKFSQWKPDLQKVDELLDFYLAKETVDKNRVYIMGLSMGGYGTYDMVCRSPDIFAAAIPICGGVEPEMLKATAGKVNFRIYHGNNDNTVPVEYSRNAYKALKQYGASVEYFEFQGVGHNCWDMAFNQPDYFSWLFAQKKR